MSPSKARKSKREGRSSLEWVVLGLALASIVAILIGLVVSGVRVAPGPPVLDVTVGQPRARGGSLEYPVLVRNRGGEAAENVEVEIAVGEETGTVTVTSVPQQGEIEGTVVLPSDAAGEPDAKISSYSVAAH